MILLLVIVLSLFCLFTWYRYILPKRMMRSLLIGSNEIFPNKGRDVKAARQVMRTLLQGQISLAESQRLVTHLLAYEWVISQSGRCWNEDDFDAFMCVHGNHIDFSFHEAIYDYITSCARARRQSKKGPYAMVKTKNGWGWY